MLAPVPGGIINGDRRAGLAAGLNVDCALRPSSLATNDEAARGLHKTNGSSKRSIISCVLSLLVVLLS